MAGIVLALVLVIPAAWFPVQLGKVAVFAAFAAVSVLLLVWSGGVRTLLQAHGARGALLVGLLPVVYVVSALFSIDKSLAWTGVAIDSDTVVFTTLAFVAFVLAFVLFRTLRPLRQMLAVLVVALAAAALFQLVHILFGVPLGGGDRSVNLIGKWNDLGLITSLLAVLLLARLELSPASARVRMAGIAGLVLVIALLTFISFGVAWIIVLGAAAIIGLVAYLSQREDARKPVASGLVVLVAALSLVFGATFNSALTSFFPVSSLEVRPAAATTVELISASHDGSLSRFALGMGPNTFSRQWLKLKPAEVNQSQFWSLDFNVGFSTLTTALLSVGVLGVIAWLIPLFLVIAGVVRALRRSVLHGDDRGAAVAVALAAFAAYMALAFYVPSANIILLAFVLAGAAFGFLWRQGQTADHEAAGESRLRQLLTLVFIALMVGVTVLTAAVALRRLAAVGQLLVAEQALAAGELDQGRAQAMRSLAIEETSGAQRLLADAAVARMVQIAQTEEASEALQEEFRVTTQEAIGRAQRAVALAPTDYRVYATLGSVYGFLATLKVDGAYDSAVAAYDMAGVHNPTSPALPLIRARIEAVQGSGEKVDEYLTKALTLKPNYTDAMLFAVELAVANNDLPTALRAAEAAAQSAPGVASIWFQLGLLHYAGGQTKEAIAPLEQAIALVPDYANAKYFLGISYYTEKEASKATALFEELKETNPEVKELDIILTNMRTGKPALQGTQPAQGAPVAE